MAINVMVFSGNCGADLELRYAPSGTAIGTVNVPCKSGWGDKEKTSWVTCKIFGERAEKLAPHITKGALVTVSGRFELEQWERDGVRHSRLVCIVDDIQLQPKGQGGGQAPQQSRPQQQPQRSQSQSPPPPADDFVWDEGDSIPF